MEEAGRLEASWDTSENNRRAQFYTLTEAGKQQLGEEQANWNRIGLAMTCVRVSSLWRNVLHRVASIANSTTSRRRYLPPARRAASVDPWKLCARSRAA